MELDERDCDFCGCPIPPADFKKGKAVVLLRRTYCEACLRKAVERSRAKAGTGSGSNPSAPGWKTPSGSSARIDAPIAPQSAGR